MYSTDIGISRKCFAKGKKFNQYLNIDYPKIVRN
jgi:hypothetical protein